MQQSYNLFESLGNSSKVWLYLAERKMSDEEVRFTLENLSEFNATWSAHGKKLNSNTTVLFNHIIVLAVDETLEVASGCSIDSSVHAIKKIGSALNIDFFNRMNVLVWNESDFMLAPFSQIRKNKGINYLNPLVSTLGELREHWIIQS